MAAPYAERSNDHEIGNKKGENEKITNGQASNCRKTICLGVAANVPEPIDSLF